MEKLLQLLIRFFAENGVAPPEVLDATFDREGSYLYELPTNPANVFAFSLYGQLIPSMHKQFQLIHLHIIVRNKSSEIAVENIQKLFDFILSLADPEKDGIQEIEGTYFIFDIRNGPTRLAQDDHQNSLWSLSVPIKCKL